MLSSKAYFEEMANDIMEWRHTLHRHPELAFEEHKTAAFVANALHSFGLEPTTGIAGTGVVATLDNGDGPVIALRADMDALPILENSGVCFTSEIPGKMHACGHDGHMAILLAAARYLSLAEDLPSGKIRFIFQPAEEGCAGAKAMIEDGLFRDFPVDEIYGLHNWPGLETHAISARVGPQMAAFDILDITIKGQGAHAAMPHNGKDTLTAATSLQQQFQTIVSRALDPQEAAVVSITAINGGDSWNVLPATVTLKGCTRHLSDEVQKTIENRMHAICAGVAQSFGVEVDLNYVRQYPATVNTETHTNRSLNAARLSHCGSVIETPVPSMASEDFAFMLKEVPGCFAWLGAGEIKNGGVLHSPTYCFNDEILTSGATYWVNLAYYCLRS